jgi:hypothetical protein
MLALGLSAWEMIETQDFREPKLELPLLLQFLPAMMSLIVDDQVHTYWIEGRSRSIEDSPYTWRTPRCLNIYFSICLLACRLDEDQLGRWLIMGEGAFII